MSVSSRAIPQERLSFAALFPYFIVLIDIVFLVYANVYGNTFLYDDEHLIVHNAFLQNWHDLPKAFTTFLGAGANLGTRYYRPFQSVLYLCIVQLAGLHIGLFHLLNVALHAANACLVFVLGRKLAFKPVPALFAALLWAIHPVHVESIAYMSATADPLYALFCLGGAIVLLPDFSPRRMGAAFAFFLLALLSKESAIAFPLLAASLIYYTSENRHNPRAYVRLWPLFALALIYAVLHFVLAAHVPVLKAPAAPSIASSGPDSFVALPVYLRLLLWPTHLYMNHAVTAAGLLWFAQLALGFGLIAAATSLALKRQTPTLLPLTWGILWFFAAFFPVSYVGHIAYEHWLYLPTAGLLLGAAQSAALALERQPPRSLVFPAFAVLIVLGLLTLRQNTIWHDPESFYGNMISSGDPAPNAHINLGVYFFGKGDFDSALKQYDLAEKDIARSTDTFTLNGKAALETNIAATLLAMPAATAKREEALRHLQNAVAFDPNYYLALDLLAQVYQSQGDLKEAQNWRDKADAFQKRLGTYKPY